MVGLSKYWHGKSGLYCIIIAIVENGIGFRYILCRVHLELVVWQKSLLSLSSLLNLTKIYAVVQIYKRSCLRGCHQNTEESFSEKAVRKYEKWFKN